MSRFWLPPNGATASGFDGLMAWQLAAMALLLLLAHVLLALVLLRRGRPRRLPGLLAVEWLPLFPLTLLFFWMAVRAQQLWALNRFQGASPGALQVEVVGVQFQWYFRYPGPDAHFGATRPALVDAAAGNPLGLDPADAYSHDDRVRSVLVLPAGREVDLRLRAQDVIHGFFIPGMRLKQNAVPGLVLHVHFTPQVPGTYPILCTQVCGLGHARMQAQLRVVSPSEYARWLAPPVIGAAGPGR